jgi:hypothetical protein
VRRFVRNRFDAEALAGSRSPGVRGARAVRRDRVVLAILVRRNDLSGIDSSAADWAHRNAASDPADPEAVT